MDTIYFNDVKILYKYLNECNILYFTRGTVIEIVYPNNSIFVRYFIGADNAKQITH